MESLIIPATNKTPEVEFSFNGTMKIKGRAIPEDPSVFFDYLQSWIFNYCHAPKSKTIIDIELEYMNSGSSKSLLQLLSELTSITRKGNDLLINWHYESGDDDMFERGEYFENVLKFPFNYKVYKS